MKLISRYKNVIDQIEDLEVLDISKNFPVFMGCVEHKKEHDITADMTWSISKSNGMVQLTNLIPLNVLYQADHDAGVIGSIWLEHHQEFASFINKVKPKSVLEIGGAHGILSREYRKEKPIDWIIVEPNPSPVEDVDVEFIKGFFDDKFTVDNEVDTIIHSHVFEHIYYPDQFLSNISKFLKDGQNLIFSLPNMEEMLKRNYTNCLNFEHTFFITEPYIEYLLSKQGFRQIDKKYFKEDHSIFYAYVKDAQQKVIKLPSNLYERNKKIYFDYVEFHNKLISSLNEKINQTPKEKPIYLFGAHIFSQYLIQCGLDTKRIICILDNDINKQGKRLYGTSMMVKSPKILSSEIKPIIILKAGVYSDEIRSDILSNINLSAIFWE